VRQAVRFVAKPGAFFNQLQWSRHHWPLLVGFLGIALVEMQVGRGLPLYQNAAQILEAQWGMGSGLALWVVMFAKLGLLLAGSSLLAWSVWLVGLLFGAQSSRRVLFRRLSVVFMVALAGYTVRHFIATIPEMGYVSLFLIFWSIALGYFAIREQFGLSHLETSVLGLMLALAMTTSWKTGHELLEKVVKDQRSQLAQVAPVSKRVVNHRRFR
jgi:hypothetical protein